MASDQFIPTSMLPLTRFTLQYRGVVHGYDQYTFGTLDPVLEEQVISFITRAWVDHGY